MSTFIFDSKHIGKQFKKVHNKEILKYSSEKGPSLLSLSIIMSYANSFDIISTSKGKKIEVFKN